MSLAIAATSSSAVRRTSANADCSSARRRRPWLTARNTNSPAPPTMITGSHGKPPPPAAVAVPARDRLALDAGLRRAAHEVLEHRCRDAVVRDGREGGARLGPRGAHRLAFEATRKPVPVTTA